MDVRPLEEGDIAALHAVYCEAAAAAAHGFAPSLEEFAEGLRTGPRQARDYRVLVACGPGPRAFARLGRYERAQDQWTTAWAGDGLLLGPFAAPGDSAAELALLGAVREQLRRCARVVAFDPAMSEGFRFYNGGWAGLSERMASLAGVLARTRYRICHRELNMTLEGLRGTEVPAIPRPLELVREERPDNRGTVRLTHRGEDVGTCHFSVMHPLRGRSPLAREAGYIDGLFVPDRWQGRGHGRLLMLHALAVLARAGCGRVLLTTSAPNHRAQNLYYSLGFHLADSSITLASDGGG